MLKTILTALSLLAAIGTAMAQAFAPEELHRRAIERRAVEAVIWGMPAVNYDLMLQEMLTKTEGKVNQVAYWSLTFKWSHELDVKNRMEGDALVFQLSGKF